MKLRQLAKTGAYRARCATVRALAAPRSWSWLRDRLHLPPNATLNTLKDGAGDAFRVTVLDPAGTFDRSLPLLPADPAALAFFGTRAREIHGLGYVAEFSGGSAWGFAGGAVFAPDGRFAPEFTRDAWGPQLHTVWTRPWLPRPRRLAGRALYLVTPEAADNYHHWLIDLLPRIGLVFRAGYKPADFDHVIVGHRGCRYQRETLEHLGIAPEKILTADERLHVRADSLVVPSLKPHNQCLPAADLSWLRQTFLSDRPPARSGRRLFLSRNDAAFRRLQNESALRPLFAEHGFEFVSTAGLDVPAQARLFAGAEWIAGVAGAAFANLVFASPGTHVLEITPPQWLSVYHWMISARLGLHHMIVLGEGEIASGPPTIEARKRDVLLSPEKLTPLLASSTPGRPPQIALPLPLP